MKEETSKGISIEEQNFNTRKKIEEILRAGNDIKENDFDEMMKELDSMSEQIFLKFDKDYGYKAGIRLVHAVKLTIQNQKIFADSADVTDTSNITRAAGILLTMKIKKNEVKEYLDYELRYACTFLKNKGVKAYKMLFDAYETFIEVVVGNFFVIAGFRFRASYFYDLYTSFLKQLQKTNNVDELKLRFEIEKQETDNKKNKLEFPLLTSITEFLNEFTSYNIFTENKYNFAKSKVENLNIDIKQLIGAFKSKLYDLLDNEDVFIEKLKDERKYFDIHKTSFDTKEDFRNDYNGKVLKVIEDYCKNIHANFELIPEFNEDKISNIERLNLKSFFKKWYDEFATPELNPAFLLTRLTNGLKVNTAQTTDSDIRLTDITTKESHEKIIELLTEQNYCDKNTFIWKDEFKGNKALLAAILKILHHLGYYKKNKKPTHFQIAKIAMNTFGLEISIETIKKADPKKQKLDFITPYKLK